MGTADSDFERLRVVLTELVSEDAGQVLAEARAEARDRVRAALADALTRELHEAVERHLEGGEPSASARRKSPAREPSVSLEASPAAPEDLLASSGDSLASPGPEPATPTGAEGALPETDGIYVYGVVWATDAPLSEGLSGFDAGGLVDTVIEGPVAAVISPVPMAEFEEEELRGHLSDLDWVERIARGHEAVLDDLCARTVVVPMRMCSVYRSEENLRSMLRREESNLRGAMEFLDGKIEWGVKVVAGGEEQAGAAPDAAAAADDARAASSGADYMARRRARRDEQAQMESLHTEAVAEIHDSLAKLAHDGRLNPVGASEVPGQTGRVVMNGVYLVQREDAEVFHREVGNLEERFAALGLELLESGPWPPYNFVPGDVGAAW